MKTSSHHLHAWAADFLSTTNLEEQDAAIHALHMIQTTLKTVPEALRVLGDASVSVEKRLALLTRSTMTSFPPSAHALIERVMEAGALDALPRLLEHIAAVRARYEVAREVVVTSAVPLISSEREMLRTLLTRLWTRHIVLHEEVDAAVIGGLRLRSEDWCVDATVHGRALRLAHTLLSA